jgi:hypothetical protein
MKIVQYLFILILSAMGIAAGAQVPKLNSYPSASATVFIDFDGHHLTGSSWNWNGPIDAQPAGFSDDVITEILNRVAEDFRPFDLNITTDSSKYWSAPYDKRIRIIVTPTWEWYEQPAGGVSYVGSFTWGDNTPAWVFSGLLNNNTKYVAEAISHEAGHSLGLQHQSTYDENCIKVNEYSPGQGIGEIGWAPIMGIGYYANVTTWNVGPNTYNCGTIQNDFETIRMWNGFGLRPDEHGNDIAVASDVDLVAYSFIAKGVINDESDVDVFKITLTAPNSLSLYATPQNVGSNNAGANIDIKLILMNGTDTIGRYNPSTLLNAGVDTSLNAGTYYLVVDGVGNVYHGDGSLGFYSVNGSVGSAVLAFSRFKVSGSAANSIHRLNWSWQTNETVSGLSIESSADGQHFTALAALNPSAKEFSYRPLSDKNIYYRLKATGATESHYSNIISLQNRNAGRQVQVINNQATDLTIASNGHFKYRLFYGNGQLLSSGTLTQGNNHISTPAVKGLLLLSYTDGSNTYTEKFIR